MRRYDQSIESCSVTEAGFSIGQKSRTMSTRRRKRSLTSPLRCSQSSASTSTSRIATRASDQVRAVTLCPCRAFGNDPSNCAVPERRWRVKRTPFGRTVKSDAERTTPRVKSTICRRWKDTAIESCVTHGNGALQATVSTMRSGDGIRCRVESGVGWGYCPLIGTDISCRHSTRPSRTGWKRPSLAASPRPDEAIAISTRALRMPERAT